ncbi:MAG: ATP-binding protein [Saprospiraceae bacterium]
MFFERHAATQLYYYLQHFPATVLLGARQVGKTTLAKSLEGKIGRPFMYLDLERPSDWEKLRDPESFLSPLREHCIVIDEVQTKPELFAVLRPIIDEHRTPGRFVLLGSAAPSVIRGASETLAGRVAYIELSPLSLPEVYPQVSQMEHWFLGGYPEVLLSSDTVLAQERLQQFVRTFAERELSGLGQDVMAPLLLRLWQMLAHVHGQTANVQELGNSLGIATKTVNRYLDLLEGGFMIRRLQPWFVNVGKRLTKTPKTYLRDSGMLHTLLRIPTSETLIGHPVCGASWEGYVIEQIIRTIGSRWEFYFYRTQQGAEIDLLLISPSGKKVAVEVKFSSAPQVSKGFYFSIEDVKCDYAFIIVPETITYQKPNNVTVCSLIWFLLEELPKIG